MCSEYTEFRAVLQTLDSFFPQHRPTSTKGLWSFKKSKILALITSIKHIHFYLAFGAPLALGEADFHKIKGRETLSKSHNDLNTTDGNVGLTESFFPSIELVMCVCLQVLFLYLFTYFDCA
jgi:hypothetical protein